MRILLKPDGSLIRVDILDRDRLYARGTFYRAAADSARRAVFNCMPLRNLPPEKYDDWRELTLNFNPREMIGQ